MKMEESAWEWRIAVKVQTKEDTMYENCTLPTVEINLASSSIDNINI